jgi:hypothetical protein
MTETESRLILPIPNLNLSKAWDVGPVRFHPAGTASGLITVGEKAEPAYQERLDQKAIEFDRSAVAEVEAADIDEAIPLVTSSLAVLRAVMHIEHPMVDQRHQTFGLPGQVMAATIDYFSLTEPAGVGWRRPYTLAGWTFTDADHNSWCTDPAFRFLHQALMQPDADRTPLQRRALVGIDLLNQAWLSWQPDVTLLNAVMALEALLGESGSGPKKFRLARRASYFVCGWPDDALYTSGQRPGCPLMTLPLRSNGEPSAELQEVIDEVRDAGVRGLYCTWFFDVVKLYDDRNTLAHGGRLGLSDRQAGQATWFIPSLLLRPVLTWFAGHSTAELADLDSEIASLRPMTA